MNRSASGSPVAAPDCGAGCSSVGQWLAGLGLADYESLFHNNGYDDLEFIVSSDVRSSGMLSCHFVSLRSTCSVIKCPSVYVPPFLPDPFRARGFTTIIVCSVLLREFLFLLSELLNQGGWDGQGV
jgi:hypothetical protein